MTRALERVAIDARYLRARSSGIGRYTERSIEQMLALRPELHLELITHPERPTPCGDHPRVRHTVFDAAANSIATRLKLAAIVDRLGAQLFHSPFNFLPAALKTPSLFTLHDIMWLLDPAYCTESRSRQLVQGTFYRHVIASSIAEARALLTVSHHSREAILKRFPDVHVSVSANGLDPFFSPVAADQAWQLLAPHLPPRRRFVLVVGQGSPYKNHDGALEAFLHAFGDRPEVYLVMVRRFERGGAKRLRALMRDARLNSRLVTLPYVSGEMLRALYGAASCLLFPSLYEGFGLPALEAMACGTAVVTSRSGAPAEVCGDAACLIDPHDPADIARGLRAVLDDRAYRDRLIQAGLKRAATFTWERCARQILSAYDEALS